ncbi:Protein N-acetyltransferase, RimJ/RimL family [Streptomyces sp. Termitarium-T10T-6]|nr:Protein N-acetyltransferase, RimJ/RimL family [Streptomyces sp. Termitarium-T10T-6]
MTRHGPLNEFCWMDLKTRDPSGTAVFFSTVLGWDFAVDEADWRRAVKISAGDHRIGGVSDLAQPVYPPGLPAHVAYYLAVDDVDHRTAVAAENGARILVPPFDAGDQGRIATLIDPVGAAVSFWRPRGFAGWPVSPPDEGGVIPDHMVLVCADPARARHFYTGTTGAPLARVTFLEAAPEAAPHWEVSVAVGDPDRVAARARELGGELVTLTGGAARLSSPEGLTVRLTTAPQASPSFLETDRLVLRPATAADAPDLLALDNDPAVMRYINGGRPTSAEDIRDRTLPRLLHDHPCTGTRGYWIAREKETGAFLGWFELRPLTDHDPAVVELGYRLNRAAWGRGYATEGARALVDKGFTDLGVQRVTANTMAVNAGSRRVMEKAGLTFVRAYTEDWPEAIEGSEHGEVEYELTRATWQRGR